MQKAVGVSLGSIPATTTAATTAATTTATTVRDELKTRHLSV